MPGIDSNTKLMLHMNGSDGSTTFTDDSPSAHTVTANGNAQIDTDQSVFGGSSLLLDGTGDYASIPDSADFDVVASNTDDWTIDFFIKLADHDNAGVQTFIAQEQSSTNRFNFHYEGGSDIIRARVRVSGTHEVDCQGGEITDENWHHIAFIKVGGEYAVYLDGTQVSYDTWTGTATFSAPLEIGAKAGSNFYEGHIDEVRIQHSNYFNASPNSGLTDTITVPTEEYSSAIIEDLEYTINLTSVLTDNKRYSESLNYNINNSVFLTDFQTYLESLDYTVNLTQNLTDFQTYLENLNYDIINFLSLQDIQSYIDSLNYIINNSYSITDLQNYIDSLNYTINHLLTVADLKPKINFNPFKNQWNIPENIKLNWSINPIKVNYKLPENFKIHWK